MEGIFERVEYKYRLTDLQYQTIESEIKKHFAVDLYGETTIQSLYYDTNDYLLIRRSIEHPLYKEKMRLRSYGLASDKDKVFLELKKKYNGIVYKRRIKIAENDVGSLLFGNEDVRNLGQIEKEMVYFSHLYKDIKPKMLILYDRTALFGTDNEIRLTFDRNIRYRDYALNLHTDLEGMPVLQSGERIMEIKTNSPFPLWLCDLLQENKIYKTPFSKYGVAYGINQQSLLQQREVS